MSGNQTSGSVFSFIVGICVGALAVILLGSKRIDQLHDDFTEAINGGLNEIRNKTKDLRRQTQKMVREAIDIGADAFKEAKKS
jgi:Sec-independent protein translocase protein TatA